MQRSREQRHTEIKKKYNFRKNRISEKRKRTNIMVKNEKI